MPLDYQRPQPAPNRSVVSLVVDLVLIGLGVWRLVGGPRTTWSIFWGVLLIALGCFGMFTWFAVRMGGGRAAREGMGEGVPRDESVTAEIERLDARTHDAVPPPPPPEGADKQRDAGGPPGTG